MCCIHHRTTCEERCQSNETNVVLPLLIILLLAQLWDSSTASIPYPAVPIALSGTLGTPAPSAQRPQEPEPQYSSSQFPSIDEVAAMQPAAAMAEYPTAPVSTSQAWAQEAAWRTPFQGDPLQNDSEEIPAPRDLQSFVVPQDPSMADTQPVPFSPPPPADSQYRLDQPLRDVSRWQLFRQRWGRHVGSDIGLGYERVMYAPLVLDTAISTSNIGIQMHADQGLKAPDRLEFLWAKAGRGPAPESKVDWIDTIFRTEFANPHGSVFSELSMRALNPEVNANTVGFGDMLVGAKATVYDGRCTKLATIFSTILNTGPMNRGLGTGHVSLEPGLLARHQWSDATFLHGQLKYRLPIAGSSGFAGDVLNTGFGVSTIWRENDQFALMPTFEMQTHTFLFGSQTLPNGTELRVDGITAVDLFPGMRLASSRSAMGLFEFGMAGGVTVADRDWFDTRIVADMRWVR